MLKGIFNRFILVVLATCFIVGCNDSNDMYCQDWEPIEYSSQSIFSNVNQPVSVIAGSSNMLALACHNCYQNNNTSYTETLSLIESAIEGNADLIELDISLSDEENTTFKISHESGSLGVSFTELIAQSSLINSTQLLFIELKNELISLEQVRGFLRVLKLYSSFTEQFAYMNENRFVTIRRFDSNQTLAKFKTVLNEQEFSDIKPFIKLSRLYYKKTEAQMYEEITTAHQCGFHMVELDVRLGVDVILSLNAYAETLGLAVNVFTLNQDNFEELVSRLKHDVDILTIEEGNWYELTNSSLIRYIRDILSE